MPAGPQEKLPKGVGRVPTWWMELTPHFELDLDDEQARRDEQERLARYYAEIASQGMDYDPSANGGTGADGSSGSGGAGWKSNWGGRSTDQKGADGQSTASKMFGGRNFQPGTPSWDPKQWGIEENDPDYKSYLSGVKLPPDYIQAMRDFGATTDTARHPEWVLRAQRGGTRIGTFDTDGKYGRMAENPKHQPSWMKKKLRSSSAGANIRQGKYNDSPNKHHTMPSVANALLQQHMQDKAAKIQMQAAIKEEVPTVEPAVLATIEHTSITEIHAAPVPEQPTMPERAPVPVVEDAPATEKLNHNFNSYYHNADANQVATVEKTLRGTATTTAADDDEPVVSQDEDEEEYEDDEDYVETANAAVGTAGDLQDLQAMLAAKQAELLRLQSLQS